jgi:hypothetical protein
MEELEARRLLSFRTFDGTFNNLIHPDWGSAGVDEIRKAPVAYADGISAPARPNDPGTRAISNAANDNPPPDVNSDRFLSDYAYVWGQFIDHDIDLTTDGTGSQLDPLNIPVPTCDPQFDPSCTGTAVIPFNRSEFDPATGTSTAKPRQHPNEITAFIDASMIYGSDDRRASLLRTHVGGHLKTSPGNLLPYNNATYFGSAAPLRNANDAHIYPDDQLFVAGDIRANENVELTNMHTLFLREHNRVADVFHRLHPRWSDDQIYLSARRYVGAELQVITYREWLPALLGPFALPPYRGYNPDVNPGIANEFATASFRLGHSMLSGTIDRLDDDGHELPDEHGNVHLRDAFFNPTLISADPNNPVGDDIDAVAKGNASDNSQEIDLRVIDDVRNFLFVGGEHPFGLDLPAINMQRGRDHGLPDYNALREAYGLRRVHSYAEINPDPDVIARLTAAYGPNNVDNIDPWLGGLAERHVPGTSTGPLIRRVLVDQFTRLRDGDRFFYLNDFTRAERFQLRAEGLDLLGTTLAKVIENNTAITNLQDNVFFFKTELTGQVFVGETTQGLAGVTIILSDGTGKELATTTTDAAGQYDFTNFDGLALGSFTVEQIVPPGFEAASPTSVDVDFTRGQTVTVNFQDVASSVIGPSGALLVPFGMEADPATVTKDTRAAEAVPLPSMQLTLWDGDGGKVTSNAVSEQSPVAVAEPDSLHQRTPAGTVASSTPGRGSETIRAALSVVDDIFANLEGPNKRGKV